jgi:hypothetical protein
MQLESDLDSVDIGPVREFIEADLADPGTRSFIGSRPRAEPVQAPLLPAVFGESGDSVWRKISAASDGWITEEALKFLCVLFAPRP